MMRGMTMGTVMILVLSAAGIGRAESVEDVQKKIVEKNKAIKSMSAKLKQLTEMDMAGFKSKSTADGSYEYMMDGDKMYVRSDTKMTSETDVGGNKAKQESSSIGVCDGQYYFTLTEQAGEKTATKSKLPDKPDSDPFKALREDYDLKLLPDETIDGKTCWVFEATPKASKTAQNPMAGGKMRQYFQKDTGAMAKNIVYTAEGKPMSTTTYSDIQVNNSIPKDRFKFTLPPGVKVMDMTQAEAGGAAGKQ
jgi:outer membrane lipoprotein-sorting protein